MEDTTIDILYLNEDDMIEAGVLDAGKCVDTMEEMMGLLSDGDFIMGGPNKDEHGLMLEFPKKSDIPNFPLNDSRDRRFIAMPAYLGGRFHVAGMKWYGSNGRNREKGLPRSILMAMLNDVETGTPLAYMSANLLSSMRTGSMPGLAAKLLAKKDSKVLAIIGPGVINKACLMAILSKMDQIDTVMIKGTSTTSRSTLEMKRFIEEKYPQIKQITLCETLEEAIRPADIVSEAVSCREGEWPEYKAEWNFAAEEEMVEHCKDLVKGVRNLRTEMDVPPSRKAKIFIVSDDAKIRDTFESNKEVYVNLAGASEIAVQADKTGIEEDAVSVVIPGATLYLPLEDLVDFEKEKERLLKEQARLEKELARSKGMLSNEKFLSKAPEAKVQEEKDKLAGYEQMMAQVKERLAQMK